MSAFWVWLVINVPVIVWQVFLLLGLSFLVCGYFFVRNAKRFWCMVSGCVFVIIAAFFLSCYAYTQTCCWVRSHSDLVVRVGPADWHRVVGTVKNGDLLCINSVSGAWKCFQSNLCNGWIYLP